MQEKQEYLFSLLFNTLYTSQGMTEISTEEEMKLNEEFLNYTERFIREINFINNISESTEQRDDGYERSDRDPMKNIIDLMNNSMKDEKLGKMALPWNPWF
jgi:hypothetical protein